MLISNVGLSTRIVCRGFGSRSTLKKDNACAGQLTLLTRTVGQELPYDASCSATGVTLNRIHGMGCLS